MRLDRVSFGKRLGGYAESISLPAQPVVKAAAAHGRPDA